MSKRWSARFYMAVIMTLAGCYMAMFRELTTEFCTIWGVVVTAYFGRTRPDENSPKGVNDGTS